MVARAWEWRAFSSGTQVGVCPGQAESEPGSIREGIRPRAGAQDCGPRALGGEISPVSWLRVSAGLGTSAPLP